MPLEPQFDPSCHAVLPQMVSEHANSWLFNLTETVEDASGADTASSGFGSEGSNEDGNGEATVVVIIVILLFYCPPSNYLWQYID
jgi:hypothetical protein